MQKFHKSILFFSLFFITKANLFCETLQIKFTELQKLPSFNDFVNSTKDSPKQINSFLSAAKPFGNKGQIFGSSFSALCDDLSYLNSNPSAASLQNQTQAGGFLEYDLDSTSSGGLGITRRAKNISDFGYGLFGTLLTITDEKYFEVVTGLNLSYNFLSGYDFKGICAGINIKTGWQNLSFSSINDINQSDFVYLDSKSLFSIFFDLGLMTQFNLFKFFYSREPNVKIGLSLKNLGIVFDKTFGIPNNSPLPSEINLAFSCKFLKPITLCAGISYPLNLYDFSQEYIPSVSFGFDFYFKELISLSLGTEFKKNKSQVSAGLELTFSDKKININYSLDYISKEFQNHKFSLSFKALLGDNDRNLIDYMVDKYYQAGLDYYANGEWEKSIKEWEKALQLNKHFDPAVLCIESAQEQIKMFKKISESLNFE